jgi:hypothetical protein
MLFQFEVDCNLMKRLIESYSETPLWATDEDCNRVIQYVAGLFWNNQQQILEDEVRNLAEHGLLEMALRHEP